MECSLVSLRRAFRAAAFTAACLLPLAPAASAQLQAVENGQRVRVTLTEQPREVEGWTTAQVLRGEVVAQRADSLWLVLHPGLGPTPVTVGAIGSLEVSRGVETWWDGAWRQGKRGALVLGLELFLAELLWGDLFDSAITAGVVGATVGFAGGAALGGLMPQEIWHPLPWPPGATRESPPGASRRPR